MSFISKITHWFPIVTLCPVNRLPDPLFITVKFKDEFVELYAVRKRLRQLLKWKTLFMEDVAFLIQKEYPNAIEIEVRLWFTKHTVTINKDQPNANPSTALS